RRHLRVDELVGVPPEDRAAVVAALGPLPPVHRDVRSRLAPDDAGRLEPLARELRRRHDLVLDHAGERVNRRGAVLVEVAEEGAVRLADEPHHRQVERGLQRERGHTGPKTSHSVSSVVSAASPRLSSDPSSPSTTATSAVTTSSSTARPPSTVAARGSPRTP